MKRKSPYGRESKVLAALLRDLRINTGLTQVDMSERAKLLQSDVSKIENGVRQVSFLEVRRWVRATDFCLGAFNDELSDRLERSGIRHPLRPSRSGGT